MNDFFKDLIKRIVLVLLVILLLYLCLCRVAKPEREAYTAVAPPMNTEGIQVVKVTAVWPEALTEPVFTPIWTEADAVALAQMAWGEARGCSTAEQAQTMWVVLNRVDAWGGTPYSQCAASGQFDGYNASHPVDEGIYAIAVDVLKRWQAEKEGEAVARELGSEYLYFTGNGAANYFRRAW